MPQIYRITPDTLTPKLLQAWIYPNLDHDLYWSDVWDSDFYVALARAGFISICSEFDGRCLLLPQIQRAYALLDWTDRRPNSGVQRLIQSDRFRKDGVTLRFTDRTADVVAGIKRAYGSECWLHSPYCALLEELEVRRSCGLHVYAVELRSGTGHLIGGELGYTIGATYTSLTGFLDRDKRWSNCGKLQLHLLGAVLESFGYAFWNLGQPQMQYKLDLGAQVTPRGQFLKRWLQAVRQQPSRELEDAVGVPFPSVLPESRERIA